MSDSDSDSDSGDSDKEIVVRHAGVREPTGPQVLRIAEPKVSTENPMHQAAKLSPPNQQAKSSAPNTVHEVENQRGQRADVEVARARLPSLVRSTSEDSMSSVISVREEDVHILMRTIPEYGQYNDKEAKTNDSYLRSALQHMPQDLLDYTDEFGNSLLLIASQYSCTDLVQILLQRGANPHKINSSGASCLHFACYKDSLSIPIVELLLDQGGSVNVAETLYGCTPLHYAASTGELALCQLLIQHGAYIHAHDFDNCSSIDYAIDAGMMELADYLRAAQKAAHATNTSTSMQNQTNNASKNNSRWEEALSPNGSVMHSLHDTNVKKSAESSTPVAPGSTVFRMIVNTNNSSLDEYDQPPTYTAPFSPNPLPHNNSSVEGPGSTSSYRTGYSKPPLPTPTYAPNSNGNNSINGSGSGSAKSSPSIDRHSDAKLSPDGPSSVKSTTSSPGAIDSTTPGNAKRSSYQPISPSPYTAVPFSPSKGTGNYVGTSSGYGSGSDSSVSSARRSAPGNNSSNGAPALPSPSHMEVLNDTSCSNIDNIKDLSPEKFEIYIEQAKSNAKLAKERELHRSVLAQKDQKINSMQSEMNIMKRTITNYKEEIHALTAKLDMLQLPFIEATNTLQDELQALKRENQLLKEQLARDNSSGRNS